MLLYFSQVSFWKALNRSDSLYFRQFSVTFYMFWLRASFVCEIFAAYIAHDGRGFVSNTNHVFHTYFSNFILLFYFLQSFQFPCSFNHLLYSNTVPQLFVRVFNRFTPIIVQGFNRFSPRFVCDGFALICMWFRNWWLFIRDTEIAIWDARDTKIANEQTHSRLLHDSEYQLLVESKQSYYPNRWEHCCQLQEKSCNCFSHFVHVQK